MTDPLIDLDQPEECIETHLARHSARSSAIYLFVLGLLLAALMALPLVRVELSVAGRGVIRPATELHEIIAPASGYVEWSGVSLHRSVARGEPILRLEGGATELALEEVNTRLLAAEEAIADLASLLESGGVEGGSPLRTPLYQYAAEHYRVEIGRAVARALRSAAERDRADALASRGLVPLADAERARGEAAADSGEVERLGAALRHDWAQALASERTLAAELRERRTRLREEASRHLVHAPLPGTIEGAASLSDGSYVRAGDVLAILSPDTALVAEVFVDPRDIGKLAPGLPARLLIDAFNYNDWGALHGQIATVADDYSLVDQRPFFRVAIALNENYLQTASGIRGQVRKGMTLQARFHVAERSLWQLIRDDLHDRLNPIHTQRRDPEHP